MTVTSLASNTGEVVVDSVDGGWIGLMAGCSGLRENAVLVGR